MLPNELLMQLEALRAGKLNEDEHKKLRLALDELPNGEEETRTFNQLWNAWDALHFQEQGVKFAEMDLAWQATDDTELAEWYMKGQLSAANEQVIETRKANDPAFAKLLEEQAQLNSGFHDLKDDDFRQKLRKWEKDEKKPTAKLHTLRPNWRRLGVIAASVLVLMVAGANWFAQQNYSDEAIVARFYKQPPLGNTMSAGAAEEEAYLTSFAAAHEALEDKDFASATRLFEALSTQLPPEDFKEDDLRYYQDNLDWSIVLAKVGEGRPEAEIDVRLQRIIGDQEHTYYREAVALQKDLGSFWRW